MIDSIEHNVAKVGGYVEDAIQNVNAAINNRKEATKVNITATNRKKTTEVNVTATNRKEATKINIAVINPKRRKKVKNLIQIKNIVSNLFFLLEKNSYLHHCYNDSCSYCYSFNYLFRPFYS